MNILGIETSCDDTSVAIIECCFGEVNQILSSVVSSQIKLHAPFGGVVPNLAARAHLENIKPVFNQALIKANNPKIDLIAVTIGPGLIPSLLVGVNFAKALAYNLNKPIIGINHLEGHLYANWVKECGRLSLPHHVGGLASHISQTFPALCLIVSGGHTQLILMKDHGQYQLLGETRDDAAGEAFDKVAKLLGLGYPGGPIISKRAESGNPDALNLPRPMLNSNDFDFSFSGLKTAVRYEIKKEKKLTNKYINDMAASFEQAVVDVLISKTIKAAKDYNVKSVMISGGVAANKKLREEMTKRVKKELSGIELRIPDISFCTDNAAMIATVGCYKKDIKGDWQKIEASANLRLVA